MRMNFTAFQIALPIAVGVFFLYVPYLNYSPVYLAHDEVFFALQAQSIASTAHDLHSRFFPLYVQIFGAYWAQPILIYFTALFLRVLPIGESAVRLPSVVVGTINVVLIYLLAKKLFGQERLAMIAAVLLALTPAHFFESRMAVDPIYPLAFVMAWLFSLASFEEQGNERTLFASGLLLGVGFYSYIASVVLMPAYLASTCLFLYLKRAPRRYYLVLIVGFVLPLIPAILWLLQHPAAFADEVRRYQLYDPAQLTAPRGFRRLLGFSSLIQRLEIYWHSFNPSLLFMSGDPSLTNSTRYAGVFLLPIAVFLPIGIVRALLKQRQAPISLVTLLGFLTAPLGVVLVGELYVPRQLVMVPFAILLAVSGVEWCLATVKARAIGVGLLVLVPIQFAYYYHDYFTDFRLRSAAAFEDNIRGALEQIIIDDDRKEAGSIYLSSEIGWIDSYWRFYLLKHRREDLLRRTRYFEPSTLFVPAVPAGTLLLSRFGAGTLETSANTGQLQRVEVVKEPNGVASFVVYQK